ncbi:unnamed protein product [Rotaria sp. Silwood1]|nr:unnamed protein product [Rotaria sp. Silwood1]CAF3459819.1 unnamed protein product [Rotaria sp. Silwood1]CAF3503820.1 unnamed protein product [Rotaria sp. Silwood1]CAF4604296.1 unnamed protein product [Rotaria sp. Silwood1]
MNRLLVRRCSMSSIEEEDEPTTSDELTIQPEKLQLSSSQNYQQLHHSPSIPDWDSELSESEQEFDDNDDELEENGEERAANRALQNFIQTCSRTHKTQINGTDGSYSPSSIHLYDEDDSAELDAIISELRDFKIQFEECSNHSLVSHHQSSIKKSNKMEQSTNHPSSSITSSSSISNTNGCVNELRTLEDQLEAALASLTLTINDCTTTNIDSQQQRSSGSSACSSGLGDEITNDTSNLYNTSNTNHQTTTTTVSFTTKIPTTNTTDDCDSAFSDSGSTDKVTSPNHDESVTCHSMVAMTSTTKQMTSIIIDQDDLISSHSQHPSKLLIRTYNDDGSTKSILIDDSMSIRDVLFVLVHKNHREPDIDYALVEILPDLHMERIFEDHQKLTEAILMWPTTSPNRLIFTKRSEKYALFRATTSFLVKDETMIVYDELLKTPDMDGIIYLKEKSRKSWKKHFCVLRSSGLYFVPKGKSKKDLVCLAKFENVELFFGLGWKKKFKSPSDYCFALKHPLIQKKSSKYIKYMCVDTKNEFDRWITSIRIAKFGQQLKVNYFLMEKAMNIYRSSGRFAAVCAARSGTSNEQQNNRNNNELCSSPMPCSSIRDRQVLNRIPILPTNTNSHNQYNSTHSPMSPQPSSCISILTTSTLASNEHNNEHVEVDDNDENSPIKSASYMDELRQRLERVLNDSPSSIQSSSSPQTSLQQTSIPIERHSCLPVSKSFRFPIQSVPIQVQSSSIYRPTPVSRFPLKSPTPSSLQTQTNHSISSSTKGTIRGPTLITPPKLKSNITTQCLSSTENLRTTNTNNTNHQTLSTITTTVGSTPLPRKQLPSLQILDRNLSYRTANNTNTYGYQYHFTNGNHHHQQQQQQQQQMSKSFIMPTKRDDNQSASSLSVASKSDSLNLDDADFSLPSPTFLEDLSHTSKNTNKILSNSTKSKPTVINNMNMNRSKLPSSTNSTPLKKATATVRTNNRPQPALPVKSGLVTPSLKLSTSISQAPVPNKSLASSTSTNSLSNSKTPTITTNKPVPPVPPRKSSIPRPSFNGTSPSFKPQPPQRGSSTNLFFHKPHVSHL